MLTIQLIHETDEGKKIDFNQFARRMVSLKTKLSNNNNNNKKQRNKTRNLHFIFTECRTFKDVRQLALSIFVHRQHNKCIQIVGKICT